MIVIAVLGYKGVGNMSQALQYDRMAGVVEREGAPSSLLPRGGRRDGEERRV